MEKSILKKAENQVRQQLFGGLALVVAVLMIANVLGWVQAATDVTNLTFNVTAGSFSIDNVPNAIAFPDIAFGVDNSNVVGTPEIDGVAITDYRGNATAWTVAVSANDFSDGTNTIPADQLSVKNGTKRNIDNCDTNRLALGSNGTLNDTGTTIINGSTQASGISGFDNGFLSLNVLGSENAGTYGAVVTYTLT